MLYTLNKCSVICQLYLSKTGGREQTQKPSLLNKMAL